ncbi:uncharacterized mitochondrial protein-like protein [Tanacetum coccineum]
MTENKCYLTEYEDYDGGFVSFGDGKDRISGKGKIKTGTLDFDNVYFCKELKYNLFSMSQICDKKNNILFTDTECLVLSSDFKLLVESKFDGKADEGFFVGYSVVSKAMREIDQLAVDVIFDNIFDCVPVDAGIKLMVLQDKDGKDEQATRSDTPVSVAGPSFTYDDPSSPVNTTEASNAFEDHLFERFYPFKNAFTHIHLFPNVTSMDDTGILVYALMMEDVGEDADLNKLEKTSMNIVLFHDQILTRIILKTRRTNHKDYQNYLFSCFLSQMEPKKVIQALEDPSWIEEMQEELLQCQLQKVWTLVNLPNGKRAIGTKWVFRNKMDERGIVVRNKARLQTIVANSTTEAEYVAAANCCGQGAMDFKQMLDCWVACLEKTEENAEFHQIVDFLSTCSINYALTAVVISESSIRSDRLFNDEDGIACLTNDEIFENLALMGYEQLSTKLTFQKGRGDSVERAITTDASLVAAQDSDNILKTQSTIMSERVLEKPNEPPLPEGHTSGSKEGCMEHTFELMDIVPPTPHVSPLTGGYILEVLDLEKEKDAQAVEIIKLKQRVKKLERKRKSSISHPRRRIYRHVESSDDDLDEEDASKIGRREVTRQVNVLRYVVSAPVTTTSVAISTVKPRTPPTTAATAFIDEDLTIVQTLIKMNEEKSKEKGVAIKDVKDSPRPIRSITTLQPLPTIYPKDKELAQRLHEEELAELDRAQKERQKQEEATSAALAEEFDEIQARIDVDHELAIRLTHEEQEKYTIKERARLLAEFFKRRKKQLAAERAEAIRNKPPIRTQVRNRMITYLKHMGKYTHQQLKHKNFEEVQKLYEREKKWIDDFKPIDDDSQQQAESTKKRPRADSEEESSKKQKLEEDNDAKKEELRDSMDVVPRDDVAIDVESLATKYPIVKWKTYFLNENMMYYQIIRADGSSKNYKIFSEMLNDFDRQDVIDLDRLVNERYETTSPEGYDLLLWGDLKTLFEPNEEDEIWKNQQDYNLIS